MRKFLILVIVIIQLFNCKQEQKLNVDNEKTPFVWSAANIYFLLIDRFNNGDALNDINFDRSLKTGKLRGFEGGDIKGITKKIEAGYFTKLGINAIWMTPIVEQVHGVTDEGTGLTYGFHGYWTRDWTAIDPNFGTKEDLHILVQTAHNHGIRIILDAVINHTGPVTDKDSVWPKDWVRTEPHCTYDNYENTTACTLVKNLPDIKTESNATVALPPHLIEKWKKEGRYEQEIAELDAFFRRTGHPRAPRFYIIKWLTDYITEFGIDGYRCDTVKHTEAYVWQEFKTACDYAFAQYKKKHPNKILDNNDFYLVGEVYNYNISHGQEFDFGDKKVNYYDQAFHSLINFELKWNAAQMEYEDLFSKYSTILATDLKGYGILNYLSSHDDGQPFDAKRQKPFESATKLLLTPGTSQIYYGDESARLLAIENTQGDASLRSNMNWDALSKNQNILKHWQKLGQFRSKHPAIGAGTHQMISKQPYVFYRNYTKDNVNDLVVIGLNLPLGTKLLHVSKCFKNGTKLYDAYSNTTVEVNNGNVSIDSQFNIVLLEEITTSK